MAPELEVRAWELVVLLQVLEERPLEREERVSVLVVERRQPRGFQPLGVEAARLLLWSPGLEERVRESARLST